MIIEAKILTVSKNTNYFLLKVSIITLINWQYYGRLGKNKINYS